MPLSPLGSNLIPSDFISGKLNGRDIFIIIRGNNLQKPLVIYWADILAALPSGVTVDNGLTENPAGNFQLGGTLIQNTTVDGVALYSMTFTSALTGGLPTLYAINSGDGPALFGGSVSNIFAAISGGNSAGGAGGDFNSQSGYGLRGASISGIASWFHISPLPTNTVNVISRLTRVVGYGGGPVLYGADGIGGSLDFEIQGDDSRRATSNSIISKWTTANYATRTSQLEIQGVLNAVQSRLLALTGPGQLILDKYTTATSFASVSGASVGVLNVDNAGNVFVGAGGGGSGTVTSVDLTMPVAFTVTGNPITTSGTLAVTAAGVASQYIRGDGQLANFPTSTGGGSSVSYYLNGSVNQGTFGGSTYYQMSKTPVFAGGTTFTRLNSAGNGLIAQFITDAGDPNSLSIPAGNWNLELFFRASSNGGSPSYYVELYKYDTIGLTFTLIATDALTPEGITNGTTLDAYFTALAVPATTLALTDRLALRVFVNTSGKTIELHTEDGTLCQVITTFSTGLTALNGLTTQVQQLAVGTSGTDFAISSVTDTHTFNLPTASALNRGALSSADWTTFNGKAPLASPAFTGSPTAPTQPVATNDTTLATTAFVTTAIKTFSPYQRQNFWNRNTGGAFGIVYVPVNDVIYITNNPLSRVYCYNCVTGALVAELVVASAIGLIYFPLANVVYASNTSSGTMFRLSTAATPTNLGNTIVSVQWATKGVEYSATKGFLTTPSTVEIFNPSTNAFITSLVIANPINICLNSNVSSAQNDRIVVTGSGGVTIINPNTNAITAVASTVGGALSNGATGIIYIASQDLYVICDRVNARLCWLTPATATTFTATYFTYSLTRCWALEYDATNQVILVVGTNTTTGSTTVPSPIILWVIDALTRVCLRTIVTNSNHVSAVYIDNFLSIKTPGIAMISSVGSTLTTEIVYA